RPRAPNPDRDRVRRNEFPEANLPAKRKHRHECQWRALGRNADRASGRCSGPTRVPGPGINARARKASAATANGEPLATPILWFAAARVLAFVRVIASVPKHRTV